MPAQFPVRWDTKKLTKKVKSVVRDKLTLIGQQMVEEIKESISRYLSEIDGPSAPGEPPHLKTGELYDSMFSAMNPRDLTLIVGSTDPKSLELEYGTPEVAARPFITPIFEKYRPIIQRAMRGR